MFSENNIEVQIWINSDGNSRRMISDRRGVEIREEIGERRKDSKQNLLLHLGRRFFFPHQRERAREREREHRTIVSKDRQRGKKVFVRA